MSYPKMSELATSFPTLAGGVPGVLPWDAEALEEWAAGPAPSHGGLCAARFVLSVWNGCTDDWRCGRFDAMEALGCWDNQHRAAFVAWASDPWWP